MAAPRVGGVPVDPGAFDEEPTREYPAELRNPTTISDAPELEPDVSIPFPELTPRERQVALLLVLGQKNSEIAVELQLSVKTVDTHRAAILRKMQKRNNVELALLACREKWIIP